MKSHRGQSTVKDVLLSLRARCVRGSVVDRRGVSVKFYFLKGCWGNPPADYMEILDRQRAELKRLRAKYTVVEIGCGSMPDPSRV